MSTRRRQSRRGAIAVGFAVGATALLGMAALATEAGVWLTARRNAQNAADAGAYAGVSSLAIRGNITSGTNAVSTVAADAVTLNGFTQGQDNTTVTVAVGYWSGSTFTTPAPSGNSANAVRVEVSRPQSMGLARLLSATHPTAWGGAIGVIEQGGPACTLTIPPPPGNGSSPQVVGRTNIAGSTTVNAPNCLMVSNRTGSRAINIQNTSAAQAAIIGGLRASGQCYNCADVMGGNMPAGYVSNAPPTPNPYAYVDQIPIPNFRPSDCASPTYLDANGQSTNRSQAVSIGLTPWADVNATPTAICDNISVGSGQTLTLTPGTYYFNSANLQQTGGTIACSGCSIGGRGVTLIFTGGSTTTGSIQITGGEFNLNAPGSGFGVPAGTNGYDGILIYRDNDARVSSSANDAIKITGNPNSNLFGAIYAPTTHVELEGTGALNQTPTGAGGCLAVVAGELTYSGNTAININACEANGTPVTRIRYVRLVR